MVNIITAVTYTVTRRMFETSEVNGRKMIRDKVKI